MAVMPMLQKKLILFPNFSVPLSREIHIRLGVRLGSFFAACRKILSVCLVPVSALSMANCQFGRHRLDLGLSQHRLRLIWIKA